MSTSSRIFVAGSTGLVGSAVTRALRARGYTTLILPTHAQLDLKDQAATRALFAYERPDVVILAAARVGGIWANWEYPFEFIQDNLAVEMNTISEAFRTGVRRLLFMGSSCIYPKLAPQPLKEEYLLTGPLEETNRAYAVAKIAGIELCRSLNREYGTQYLSLMPTNLYGPGDNFELTTSHVLPALLRKFHEAKLGLPNENGDARPPHAPVTLWGTGTPRREFLHADDLAEAVLHLLEGNAGSRLPDGMVNIGCGSDLTIRELAEMVQKAVGHKGEILWDRSKPDGTPQKLLDISRVKALGWAPKISLERGVRMTYEWYLANNGRLGDRS
ncbi:MAG: GDP-L-fucose synthase [Gaiellales bacterium]|nr:GDP-L-fucose synthase [Gaiellales bacterium]